jgi:hypothetical protein
MEVQKQSDSKKHYEYVFDFLSIRTISATHYEGYSLPGGNMEILRITHSPRGDGVPSLLLVALW